MLDVMQRCFADRYQSWLPKLKEMVPSLGVKLSENPELFDEVWAHGSKVLGLEGGPDAGHGGQAVGPDSTPATGDPEPAGVG
jgi:malate dehydrogenase (quinone)